MTDSTAASPARRFLVPALFVIALLLVTMLRDRPTPAEPELWILSGPTMGTTFQVKVVVIADDERGLLEPAITAQLEAVDASMSTWRADSELSAFNRSGAGAFPASEMFLAVMSEALDVAKKSDGAFDPTVGPLVDAWGFGPDAVDGPPDADELDRMAEVVGWQRLSVDREAGTVSKSVAGVEVDLSAIAKGFAVDRVSQALSALGQVDHLVEIGGELRASGRAPGGRAWRVAVERPGEGGRAAQAIIELDGVSLATSGDYRNFIVVDGQRLSHTVDPRNGRPVTHHTASVSVVSKSCMRADAWATTLSVVGPEEAVEMAEREGVAALFLIRDGDRLISRMSPGFPEIAEPSPYFSPIPTATTDTPHPAVFFAPRPSERTASAPASVESRKTQQGTTSRPSRYGIGEKFGLEVTRLRCWGLAVVRRAVDATTTAPTTD